MQPSIPCCPAKSRRRAIFPWTVTALVFSLSFGLTLSLAAQEGPVVVPAVDPVVDDATDGTTDDAALREKTIYVPYDKLAEVFEKEGRGVFLPYKEFLELWKRAQPKPEPPPDYPPPAEAVISGGQYTGAVEGELAELNAVYRVDALKKKGWSVLALPMQDLSVESAEVTALGGAAATADDPRLPLFVGEPGRYAVFFPRPGSYEVKLKLVVRVQSKPGQRSLEFGIPAAATSTLNLTLPEENPRVEVEPKTAATRVSIENGATRVVTFLGNATRVRLSWSPPVGKIQEEEALVLGYQHMRVYLGERVLRIFTAARLQILNQEISRVRVRIPDGMQLLSVDGDNIRESPILREEGVVEIRFHSGIKDRYDFQLSFERILEQTPESLDVAFPQIEGVLRESGYIALGYDRSLRVRVASMEGLSQQDLSELPEEIRGEAQVGFRYLAHPLKLGLAVEKIEPLVHANSTSVVIAGVEEDVWIGWIDYRITRSGKFELRLSVPAGWRVVSIGDENTVEDFQSSPAPGDDTFQVITVNLKNRAFGQFRLPFRLAKEGSASEGEWTVYAPRALDVESDRGLLGVSAPRSFNLTTVSQERTSRKEKQELFRSGILSQVPQDSSVEHAFTYNDQPASVRMRLEPKPTEIKVVSRLLVNVKDNAIEYSQDLEYHVQFAGVDRLSFSTPASLDTNRVQVQFTGQQEIPEPVTSEGRTVWEVVLERQEPGVFTGKITYQADLGLDVGQEKQIEIPLIRAEGVESDPVGWIAVRKEGSLEIQPVAQEFLETIASRELPPELAHGQIFEAFKLTQSDYRLALLLKRHDYHKVADAIVPLMEVAAHLSSERSLTCLTLFSVETAKRQYLELRLPARAKLIGMPVVNGREVSTYRTGGTGEGESSPEDLSIPLGGAGGAAGNYVVRMEYRVALSGGKMGSMGSFEVETPQFIGAEPRIPVGKIELSLYVPQDCVYIGHEGNLHLRPEGGPDPWLPWKQRLWGLLGIQPEISRANAANLAGRQPGALFNQQGTEVQNRLQDLRQGRLLALEGYEPDGRVAFSFVGKRTFRVISALLFLAAVAASLWVLRTRPNDRWWWIGGGVLLFVLLAWLQADERATWCVAVSVGGFAVFAVVVVRDFTRRSRSAVAAWRAERLALAPDPFLEDAGGTAPPPAPEATTEGTVEAPSKQGAKAVTEEGAASDSKPDTAESETTGTSTAGQNKPARRRRPRKKKEE